ncbi:multicopper oxidase family protein [Glycomyces buryatensis]|uniref:Multicopper oxidase family protein n=1 Tax=Glycomyces buryatensis TaxID=2570927 RepID=A0A4S8QCV4_9ACTN|nr:multicopper oxidase family protein [Glycomyces buryatensis]THV42367.1 multicopper oxidase family protein [Glycomyces buryatensis]
MRALTRRSVLRSGAVAIPFAALAACSEDQEPKPSFVGPDSERVAAAEAARNPGAVREITLNAVAAEVDLGGLIVPTWTYGGTVPGAPIRVAKGEQIKATLVNDLPAATTVHWHGLQLRCDADGVPDLTQAPVEPGETYTYRFTAADSGTHWFHPHMGTQLDRGLYAPLIVEDPDEAAEWDLEWTVVLDDWMDGVTGTPDDVLAALAAGMDMEGEGSQGGHDGHGQAPTADDFLLHGAESELLGPDAGDVRYPHHLVNGRIADDPEVFEAEPGARVRLRIINAGADTAYRVALSGHKFTVTHTDGFACEQAEADAILIGMGERYDAIVTLQDGAFALVAEAEGKQARGRALVRTGSGEAPAADFAPAELTGHVLSYAEIVPAETTALEAREPDRVIDLELTGGMAAFDWAINGRPHDLGNPYPIEEGERVRLRFVNGDEMWHPMHLHGHSFALAETGLRKDTAIVLPGETVEVDFDAVNPGTWMLHCHNLYHGEVGMMAAIGYLD